MEPFSIHYDIDPAACRADPTQPFFIFLLCHFKTFHQKKQFLYGTRVKDIPFS
jgi:hypothetical protein